MVLARFSLTQVPYASILQGASCQRTHARSLALFCTLATLSSIRSLVCLARPPKKLIKKNSSPHSISRTQAPCGYGPGGLSPRSPLPPNWDESYANDHVSPPPLAPLLHSLPLPRSLLLPPPFPPSSLPRITPQASFFALSSSSLAPFPPSFSLACGPMVRWWLFASALARP